MCEIEVVLDDGALGTTRTKHEGDGHFRQVYFGRLVGSYFPDICPTLTIAIGQIEEGTARALITMFDVKKRSYYGNTSMESQISLLMANQTLVRTKLASICQALATSVKIQQASPGKLIYDPFIGTGSMAYVSPPMNFSPVNRH